MKRNFEFLWLYHRKVLLALISSLESLHQNDFPFLCWMFYSEMNNFEIKWVVFAWWSFRPNSAWVNKETTTITKMHPTLLKSQACHSQQYLVLTSRDPWLLSSRQYRFVESHALKKICHDSYSQRLYNLLLHWQASFQPYRVLFLFH